VGAFLVLWLASPTISAFFLWQAVGAAGGLLAAFLTLLVALPHATRRPRFRVEIVRHIWAFAAGAGGLAISSILLTQVDKWILIKLISLEAFGYYAIALTVANSIGLLVAPIFNALYPRFTALVAANRKSDLIGVYHLSTQLIAATVVPAAIFLSLFSHEVLKLWIRDSSVAQNAAPLLSVLVLGTALNGIVHMPYALELARGRTSVFLRINLAALLLLVPAVWIMASWIGALGAAIVWLAVNLSYLAIAVPLVNADFPSIDKRRWYFNDVLVPAVCAFAVLLLIRVLPSESLTAGLQVLTLGGGLLLASLFAGVSCTNLREAAYGVIRARRLST
jgi:O-antigen/teichoic acid export membrane protein